MRQLNQTQFYDCLGSLLRIEGKWMQQDQKDLAVKLSCLERILA